MSLLYPEYLWFLLLTLPVALMGIFRFIRGERVLGLLTYRDRAEMIRLVFGIKTFLLTLTFILFLVSIVFALAQPYWGESPETTKAQEAMDISLVVDLSRSMLAKDVEENRLSLAIDTIHTIMQSFPESRFSLVGYKGKAYTLVPLTEDKISIESLLPQLNPGMITAKGSDLSLGISTALETFSPHSSREQFIVVFSDGESHSGDILALARRAAKEEIKILTLGFGTQEGAPIPLSDGSFVTDSKGMVVHTSLNSEGMKEMARQTEGWYSHIVYRGDIPGFISELEKYQHLSRTRGIRLKKNSHSSLFIMAAVIMIFLNFMIRLVRWKEYL